MADRLVRLGAAADAEHAVSIWREAAIWLASNDVANWSVDQFDVAQTRQQAELKKLVIGLEEQQPVATMLLSEEDAALWPVAGAQALYLHKLAVRRLVAGNWAQSLLRWAEDEALRRGKTYLRLDCLAREKLVNVYRTNGFASVDGGPIDFFGHKIVRMEKPIGTA
jgi:GNAT superfamily N-acetyltransferase